MFGTEAMRLLRSKWKTPFLLAQELFALFQNDVPLEHSGGLTLTGDNPLTIQRGNFGDGPLLTFKRGSDEWKFGIDSGKLTLTGPDITIEGQTTGTTATPTTPQEQDGTIAESYPGKVVAGSGSTYRVNVYKKGLSESPTPVSVKQLSIASDATIPAGTWTLVSRNGTGTSATYTMQVPVWGDDA